MVVCNLVFKLRVMFSFLVKLGVLIMFGDLGGWGGGMDFLFGFFVLLDLVDFFIWFMNFLWVLIFFLFFELVCE